MHASQQIHMQQCQGVILTCTDPSGVVQQLHTLCEQVTAEAGKYLVEQFVVHGLVAAVALPMTVMSAANLIDTWWTVCLDRAEKAGKLLAHVLMSGAHGDR